MRVIFLSRPEKDHGLHRIDIRSAILIVPASALNDFKEKMVQLLHMPIRKNCRRKASAGVWVAKSSAAPEFKNVAHSPALSFTINPAPDVHSRPRMAGVVARTGM